MSRLTAMIAAAILLATPSLAQDAREPAVRTEAERAFILAQMRLFLQSTQAIATALATDDLKIVAAQASARGRKGTPLSEIPPGMKAKETPAWTAMMGGARAGFDDMAGAAQADAPPAKLMGMLGETMRNCVACHQTYRLVVE
jgi:cytochrome c556